jgi:hypothetical protein
MRVNKCFAILSFIKNYNLDEFKNPQKKEKILRINKKNFKIDFRWVWQKKITRFSVVKHKNKIKIQPSISQDEFMVKI